MQNASLLSHAKAPLREVKRDAIAITGNRMNRFYGATFRLPSGVDAYPGKCL